MWSQGSTAARCILLVRRTPQQRPRAGQNKTQRPRAAPPQQAGFLLSLEAGRTQSSKAASAGVAGRLHGRRPAPRTAGAPYAGVSRRTRLLRKARSSALAVQRSVQAHRASGGIVAPLKPGARRRTAGRGTRRLAQTEHAGRIEQRESDSLPSGVWGRLKALLSGWFDKRRAKRGSLLRSSFLPCAWAAVVIHETDVVADSDFAHWPIGFCSHQA